MVARQGVTDEGHMLVAEPAKEHLRGEGREVAPPRPPPLVEVASVRPIMCHAVRAVLVCVAAHPVAERLAAEGGGTAHD